MGSLCFYPSCLSNAFLLSTQGLEPLSTCAVKLQSVFQTAHALQRLITRCTANVGRRPIKNSAPQTALKKVPQSLEWSQIISPASAIPLWKQSTRRLCLVATCGGIQGSYHSIPEQQEMRLHRTGATKKINTVYGRIHVYFKYEFDSAGIMSMPRSDFHIRHKKKRCYNQKCINKSEDAAKAASKRSDTDQGPALRKELARRKAFILETREERSDVAEVQAVMFFAAGGMVVTERQMKRRAKSSKSFHRLDKERGEASLTIARQIRSVKNYINVVRGGKEKTHHLLIWWVHKRPPAIFAALFIVKKA